MLPEHFKIPGHSGTDQKHRKAFDKIGRIINNEKRIRKTKNNSSNRTKVKIKSYKEPITNKIIKLVLLAFSVFSISIIIIQVSKGLVTHDITIKNSTAKIKHHHDFPNQKYFEDKEE